MRTSITFKLFLALLATCIVVALAMGGAVRYSFDSGFDDYIQEREHQRLDDLAQTLAIEYAEAGSWRFLQRDHQRWWRSLRLSRREMPAPGPGSARLPPFRVMLVDVDMRWLAGPKLHPGPGWRHYPVKVDDQTVGLLVSPPLVPMVINDEIDREFQARQLRATWIIVGLSVLLAALVSLWLARILLVPVRRVAQATHRLASGDYGTRVQVGTRDELGRLALDFNRLAHSLARNERLRREWMADVSHELRTPLAVLRGEIEALQDGLRPLDQSALASLAHEVGQLSQLIDDLYELSLADAGALNYHMQAVDLSEVVARAVDAVRERFMRRGLEIDAQLEPGLMIQGDERRLSQLLANVLENSLRYTDAPGQVRVRTCQVGPGLMLEVADSAPGVAPDQLPRLFERLYRVEASRSREHGGAGLGLAICRHIAQAHGAQIRALASDLGGVAIRVEWPVYAPDEE
ncbi:MAG TPA: ATP-binding protein [Castellaniella sp.]|uniref:ATP-binding protein n=1 Tax=Castellaniella sp. TaxID=1955812 RepID=UPI002F11FABF